MSEVHINWVAVCRFRTPCGWKRPVRSFDEGIIEEAKHSQIHITRLSKGLGGRGPIPVSGRRVSRGQCLGCNRIYSTYSKAEAHRDLKHPNQRIGVRMLRSKDPMSRVRRRHG